MVINTTRGDCGSGLRYAVRIIGGRVTSEGGYSVSGAVAPSGAIQVFVSEGGHSASGSGRLAGNSRRRRMAHHERRMRRQLGGGACGGY